MRQALTLIDKHVAYLFDPKNAGGLRKLEEWFLTGDRNFIAYTAERYIISYLKHKNSNLHDMLGPKGADAYIQDDGSNIGIEITTLNGFIVDWMLAERLKEELIKSGYLKDKYIEITYSFERVWREAHLGLDNYIGKLGLALFRNDQLLLSQLEVSVETNDRFPGTLAWRFSNSDAYPWFRNITYDLMSKLNSPQKIKQLEQYKKNLIFVGVNHAGPNNWIIPGIFEDLSTGEKIYQIQIQYLRDYWVTHLPKLTNVVGICYFTFDIASEIPYYPLKIFWRSERDVVDINL